MSFDGEWSGLRAEAASRMRINSARKGSPGEDSGDLVVRQDDLGRVGHEAFLLHARLKKAGDMTRGAKDDGATAKAASALGAHHFSMGDALTTMATMWNDQLKTLLQACAHISNGLDYTKKSQSHTDKEIGASLTHRNGSAVSVSEISRYYR
ncbi:hypothetical protein [Streptomyces coffeae]|uniref:AG1 protein n=1 Tax=Streptomyces coffeae TaxID=621382 RepID=A0ABS1N6V8_9ACTN|nr:hypothetical protein [Streptomyces coffeae]MBL1095737.1 hypothetical protein [Streptomyces coffeae]